jgi:galactokinase
MPRAIDFHVHLPISEFMDVAIGKFREATERYFRMEVKLRDIEEIAAYYAEREIVGVPCGPLDHRAVVGAREGGVMVIDCAGDADRPLPWPWDDIGLVVCDTGRRHEVGGESYRNRRAQVASALALLGDGTAQEALAKSHRAGELPAAQLPGILGKRFRHVVTETARALASAGAIERRDAECLGKLMLESHASLREEFEVSTPQLDAAVDAALRVPGCLGARLVGAGFGGSVAALVRERSARECGEVMATAAGPAARYWCLRPGAGVAQLAADVVHDRS